MFPTQKLNADLLHCRSDCATREALDYTLEVINRFKRLDLIEYLKHYGQRFITLYERQ